MQNAHSISTITFDRKFLLKLVIPLVIEQILAVTVGMADMIMVSGAGETAVSGVSLVNTIATLLIYVFTALATGGAVEAIQLVGHTHFVDKAGGHIVRETQAKTIALIEERSIARVFGRTRHANIFTVRNVAHLGNAHDFGAFGK